METSFYQEIENLKAQIIELTLKVKNIAEMDKKSFRSMEIDKLAAALSKAQGEMEDAYFNRVGYQKNNYANLYAIIKATRPTLKNHGLSVTQNIITESDGKSYLYTELLHESGQWTSSKVILKPAADKGDSNQGFGGAVTYMSRYAFKSLLGVIADDLEDDDGKTADKGYDASNEQDQEKIERITQEQLDEINHLLQGHTHLAQSIKRKLEIKYLYEIPKEEYAPVINYIRTSIDAMIKAKADEK